MFDVERSMFKIPAKPVKFNSLEHFTQKYSHILEESTNYLTSRQLVVVAERSGLTISFRYTKDFFISKLLSYIGKRPYCYKYVGSLEAIGSFWGKWLSSVMLYLKKIIMTIVDFAIRGQFRLFLEKSGIQLRISQDIPILHPT